MHDIFEAIEATYAQYKKKHKEPGEAAILTLADTLFHCLADLGFEQQTSAEAFERAVHDETKRAAEEWLIKNPLPTKEQGVQDEATAIPLQAIPQKPEPS